MALRHAALIGLLMLALPAGAQTHGVIAVTMAIETGLPLDSFEPVPSEGIGSCTTDHVQPTEGGHALRFEEDVQEEGCSHVWYSVAVPEGATAAYVIYSAMKDVGQASTSVAVHVDTLFLVRDAGGSQSSTRFFNPGAVSQFTEEPRIDQVPLEPGQSTIAFGWSFHDRPTELAPPLGDLGIPVGRAVQVDIIDATVRFEGIPVGGDVEVRQVDVTNDRVEQHVRVPAIVPEGVTGADLLFRVQGGLSTHHVLVPDGRRLANSAFTDGSVEGVHQLRIPAGAIATYGSGTYTAVFASTTALEPTPALVPLIALLVIAPLPLGIFATRSAQRFQSIAVGGYVKAARNLRVALAFWWLVYAGAILLVVVGRMWPIIVAWPIQIQAAVVHGSFAVISLVFISLGFYWRRQLVETMESELGEKERTNRNLQRSNEELQQFAYVASHDLQEPLRTVARFTQLLERRYGEKLDDDAREFMAYTVNGAKRMQTLIDGLLELSRVESRGRSMAPIDLNGICERATRALAASIATSGAHVTCQPLPTVLGDEMQLGQVFQNLMGNALKFHAPDRPPEIEVRAERKDHEWIISIADNGIGIERRHFERIFVVFQRLHARDEFEGTGMGLALCKKIIDRHGGRIWLESKPGKGSTFYFSLLDPHEVRQSPD